MNTGNTSSPLLVTTPIVLMAPRHDGIEVLWGVSRPAKGKLEWQEAHGTSRGSVAVDRFGFVPQSDRLFRIALAGLAPGREYRVRSITEAIDGNERIESDWKSFRTLDPTAATTHFAVWNDTHENEETMAALHALTPPVDFLLWNGDTCKGWHSPESLVPKLLHPAGCDISQQRPLLLTWGNHDTRGIWAYLTPQVIATPSGLPYHALRSGPVAFIFLHTGEDKPDDHPSFGGRVAFDPLRQQQAEWMQRVIAQPGFCDAPYRVVCGHLPLRWQDPEPQGDPLTYTPPASNPWHEILVEWKTQLVIAAHTHTAEWMPATQRIPYAQVIGGGPTPAEAAWIEGQASPNKLVVRVHNLIGQEVIRQEIPPHP